MNCPDIFRRTAASLLLGSAALCAVSGIAEAANAPLQPSCQLHSANGAIKRVIAIQFDNVHLRRDNPNIPSDLEQMPNLLNFIQNNGTLSGNHYTPLISHTATDILTTLTGVYGDRMGIPVSNSYGYFNQNGTVSFSSSFLYWTALAGDGKPQMINENGKTAPAPWVAFTRAGCDVGAFSVANIEFESVPADVTTVYGSGSPEDTSVRAQLASSDPATKATPGADWLGIAIHCAQGSQLCANGKDDLLADEPNGYTGYKALYGNINVQPAISAGPVKDLDGNAIVNAFGHPGFPNTFNPLATQSLGYAATMLEAGVPVVYIYIADAHDNRFGSGTYGPGEAGYVAQLKQYDDAFGKFFARLAAEGITKDNTLFVVSPDENDHFVGGQPSPANCDGINTPCTYAQIGEINTHVNRLLLTQRNNSTLFSLHNDDAPNFYIKGNPAPTAATTRTLEHDVDALSVINPITLATDKLSQYIADPAAMKLLHMITASPARTPTFTMFGNPDYFNTNANTNNLCSASNSQGACVVETPGFAWNHGDVQQQITRAWLGMVGPGVLQQGRNDTVFSDHTDIRPTLLALVGLGDDYKHDGRVLVEKLATPALPPALAASRDQYALLATLFKQINAPLGVLGRSSLAFANHSIVADDTTYGNYLTTIGTLTSNRDALAGQMSNLLAGAAFNGAPIQPSQVSPLLQSGRVLLQQALTLPH
jgi:hypothetical protein